LEGPKSLVLFINHHGYGAICSVTCQATATDTFIPKFDFSKEREGGAEAACELEFSLFRSSLPAAPHTALFVGALFITLF
jgi:hypothetical protein